MRVIILIRLEKPHPTRRQRHRHILADAHDLQPPRNPGEFRRGVIDAGDTKPKEHKERTVAAKILTDEVGESFASMDPHAQIHFLHDHQSDKTRDQRPDQFIAVQSTGHRIRRDPAGVIINAAGNESRPKDRRKKEDAFDQRHMAEFFKE